MQIYGLGIIAFCMFMGSYLGDLLGIVLGINGNVGGVGFAMLFLILWQNRKVKLGKPFHAKSEDGILFLGQLYIPVVVAMSAKQNVVGAFSGGLIAILAGAVATIGALFLVPLVSKLDKKS